MDYFTDEEIEKIRKAIPGGSDGNSNYYDALNLAASIAETKDGADRNVVTWLRGAADVNANNGSAYSTFIRSYTDAQLTQRGITPSGTDQSVSDQIASSVLNEIFDAKKIPSIGDIAEKDAGPAAKDLFGGDISGWSGCPLFVALSYDAYFSKYIIGDEERPQPYNAVAMLSAIEHGPGRITGVVAGTKSFVDNGSAQTGDSGYEIASRTTELLDRAYGDATDLIIGNITSIFNANPFTNHIEFHVGVLKDDDTYMTVDGNNLVVMSSGNDSIAGSSGNDIIDGGAGQNAVSYSALGHVDVALSNLEYENSTVNFTASVKKFANGATSAGEDDLFEIQSITGTKGDDNFYVQHPLNGQQLTLDGAGGNDTLDFSQQDSLAALHIGDPSAGSDADPLRITDKSDDDTYAVSNMKKIVVATGSTVTLSSTDTHAHVTAVSGASTPANAVTTISLADSQNSINVFDGNVGPYIQLDNFDVLIGSKGSDTFAVSRVGKTADAIGTTPLHTIDGGGGSDTFRIDYTFGLVSPQNDDPRPFSIQSQGGSTFNFKNADQSKLTTIVWGGDGQNEYDFTTKDKGQNTVPVVLIDIKGMSEDVFNNMDKSALQSYIDSRYNLSGNEFIIINPQKSDTLSINGAALGSLTRKESGQYLNIYGSSSVQDKPYTQPQSLSNDPQSSGMDTLPGLTKIEQQLSSGQMEQYGDNADVTGFFRTEVDTGVYTDFVTGDAHVNLSSDFYSSANARTMDVSVKPTYGKYTSYVDGTSDYSDIDALEDLSKDDKKFFQDEVTADPKKFGTDNFIGGVNSDQKAVSSIYEGKNESSDLRVYGIQNGDFGIDTAGDDDADAGTNTTKVTNYGVSQWKQWQFESNPSDVGATAAVIGLTPDLQTANVISTTDNTEPYSFDPAWYDVGQDRESLGVSGYTLTGLQSTGTGGGTGGFGL